MLDWATVFFTYVAFVINLLLLNLLRNTQWRIINMGRVETVPTCLVGIFGERKRKEKEK